MLNILILCTGNSCRSIIGEALFNHLGSEQIQAFSAGSFPTGKVNENALKTLRNHNIKTDHFFSKSWDELSDQKIDIVITVCDNAAGEICPIYLNNAIKVHWGLPDPANVSGSESEVKNAFEKTYSELENRIKKMLLLPFEKLSVQESTVELNKIGK